MDSIKGDGFRKDHISVPISNFKTKTTLFIKEVNFLWMTLIFLTESRINGLLPNTGV
jgi:hypothetical protein